MKPITSDDEARAAVERAVKQTRSLEHGLFLSENEPQVIRQIKLRLTAAQAYYAEAGNPLDAARQSYHFARLAHRGEHAPESAIGYLREAVARFSELGATQDRYLALMEWGELDPGLAEAEAAARARIAEGLTADLEWDDDPKRLATAKQYGEPYNEKGRDPDGALSLLDALTDEALSREDHLRAADLMCDIARLHEDVKKDKVTATEVLERALPHAESSNDRQTLARVLLRLTDIWMERRKRKTALAYFERAEKVKRLPSDMRLEIRLMRATFDGKSALDAVWGR